MASKAPLVPSKNALRALRKLAFPGSAAVGAVGSVSGLAVVSYDIRQRLHLAESVVETKKILQSQAVSNTNRKVHMAAIFEMYEKDQGKEASESWNDFNRRARRHYSQSTTRKGSTQTEQLKTDDVVPRHELGMHASRSQSPGTLQTGLVNGSSTSTVPRSAHRDRGGSPSADLHSQNRRHNSPTAQSIVEASQTIHKVNSNTVYGRPKATRDVSHVQKIITATQQQHKLNAHAVFGRPQQAKIDALPGLPNCVQQWLAPNNQAREKNLSAAPPRRFNISNQKRHKQVQVRRYSTVASLVRDSSIHMEIEDSTLSSNMSWHPLSPNQTKNTASNHGRTSIPKLADESLSMAPSSRKVQQIISHYAAADPENATSDAKVKILYLVDDFYRKSASQAVHFFRDISSFPTSSTAPVTTPDKVSPPSAVFDRLKIAISTAAQTQGMHVAGELIRSAMQIYADSGTPPDLGAIDILHSKYGKKLRLRSSEYPVAKLIQSLLQSDDEKAHERATQILFRREWTHRKGVGHAKMTSKWNYQQDVSKFIGWLCQTDKPSILIIHEFCKLLEVIQREGCQLNDSIFAPMLRMFVERNELKYLRSMFNDMVITYGIEPTGNTKIMLLLGLARAREWDQVYVEFESMHADNTSRKEPFHFAVLFNSVLDEHGAVEPIEKTHDLLLHAVLSWGLVPVSQVSATAIQAYIRHGRYDLIREWLDVCTKLWPDLRCNSTEYALALAMVWEEIGASCEEIEDTFLALSRRRDILASKEVRSVAQEALARHFAFKLCRVEQVSDSADHPLAAVDDEWNLSFLLRSALAVISHDAGSTGIVTRSDVADLLNQTRAVFRLRKLFGLPTTTTVTDINISGHFIQTKQDQASQKPSQAASSAALCPEELRRDPLPPDSTLLPAVLSYYTQRSEGCEPVNHDALRTVCEQLSRSHRYYTIFGLIESLSKHAALQEPNGINLDMEIFQRWLEAAYRMRAITACTHVLHTLIDHGSTIRLTSRFRYLMRMVTRKLKWNRFDLTGPGFKDMVDDLNYSRHILLQRFFTQRKSLVREERLDGVLFDWEENWLEGKKKK